MSLNSNNLSAAHTTNGNTIDMVVTMPEKPVDNELWAWKVKLILSFDSQWAPRVTPVWHRTRTENLLNVEEGYLHMVRPRLKRGQLDNFHVHLTVLLRLARFHVNGNVYQVACAGDSGLKANTVYLVPVDRADDVWRLFDTAENLGTRGSLVLGDLIRKVNVPCSHIVFGTTWGDVESVLRKRGADYKLPGHLSEDELLPEGGVFTTIKSLHCTQIRALYDDIVIKGACVMDRGLANAMREAHVSVIFNTDDVKSSVDKSDLDNRMKRNKDLMAIGVKAEAPGLRNMQSSYFITQLLELGGGVVPVIKEEQKREGYTSPVRDLLKVFNPATPEEEAREVLSSLLGADHIEPEGDEMEVPSYLIGAVKAGLPLHHPMIQGHAMRILDKRLTRHVVGGGVVFSASRVHPDSRLKEGEICDPSSPEGMVAAVRYPVCGPDSLQAVFNRHLDGVKNHIAAHPSVMKSLLGDFDGDWVGVSSNARLIDRVLKAQEIVGEHMSTRDNHLWTMVKKSSPRLAVFDEIAESVVFGNGFNGLTIGQATLACVTEYYDLTGGEESSLKFAKDFGAAIDAAAGAFKNKFELKNEDEFRTLIQRMRVICDRENPKLPPFLQTLAECKGRLFTSKVEAPGAAGVIDALMTKNLEWVGEMPEPMPVSDREWQVLRAAGNNVKKWMGLPTTFGDDLVNDIYDQVRHAFEEADGVEDEGLRDEILTANLALARQRCNEVTDKKERLAVAASLISRAHSRFASDSSRGQLPFMLMPEESLLVIQSIYAPEDHKIVLRKEKDRDMRVRLWSSSSALVGRVQNSGLFMAIREGDAITVMSTIDGEQVYGNLGLGNRPNEAGYQEKLQKLLSMFSNDEPMGVQVVARNIKEKSMDVIIEKVFPIEG